MCYEYYKEQSAARKDSTESPATPPRETATPAAEPVAGGRLAEETAYSSFLDRLQTVLAIQKQKGREPTSV